MRMATSPAALVVAPLALALAFGSAMLDASPAAACGAAYPVGTFARLAAERTVIVWDAAAKREHFVRKPTFEGDANEFGFFMPTPSVPEVAKESDLIVDRVAALAAPPDSSRGNEGAPGARAVGGAPAVDVLQTVHIDDFEIVTLKATSADALGAWLGKHGFVDRPNLRAWAKRYLDKGWVVSAMRYAAPQVKAPAGDTDAGAAAKRPPVATPTLRFSFAIDKPFYPYTEPQPEKEEEAKYLQRTGTQGIATRPLFVWLVADTPLEAFQGDELSGPYLHATAKVSGPALAQALGDTKGWGLDLASTTARRQWTVTYLNQFEDRVAHEDVTFAPARVLVPTPSASHDAAVAPTGGHERRASKRGTMLAAILLGALVTLVLVLELRGSKSNPGG